jgi:DNA polymerase II large subunit
MPTFRCTSCERRVESPVVIGAGDCPRCGGDVVYDIHGQSAADGSYEEAGEPGEDPGRVPLLRRILRR